MQRGRLFVHKIQIDIFLFARFGIYPRFGGMWVFIKLHWCRVVVLALYPPPWCLGVRGVFYFAQTGLRWWSRSSRSLASFLLAVSFEASQQRVQSFLAWQHVELSTLWHLRLVYLLWSSLFSSQLCLVLYSSRKCTFLVKSCRGFCSSGWQPPSVTGRFRQVVLWHLSFSSPNLILEH